MIKNLKIDLITYLLKNKICQLETLLDIFLKNKEIFGEFNSVFFFVLSSKLSLLISISKLGFKLDSNICSKLSNGSSIISSSLLKSFLSVLFIPKNVLVSIILFSICFGLLVLIKQLKKWVHYLKPSPV